MKNYRSLIQQDLYLINQVAHYAFDSNSNDSINGQNGTDTNIVYTNAGILGNSATFNGTSSLISIADNDNFSFSSLPFSINVWVYPVGNSGYLISKRNSSFIEFQSTYNISSGTILLQLFSGGVTSNLISATATSSALTANAWNLVTFTHTGSNMNGDIKIYLNGVLCTATYANTGTYTGISNTSAGLVLGRIGNSSSGYFNGRMDKLRIWKGRELTQTEITNIYNTQY